MASWRPGSVLLVKVAALALPLALLWLAPLLLLERQREARLARQSAEVAGIAMAAESLVQGRLMTVERLLFAAQQAGPAAETRDQLDGLVRGLLVLQPGEERSFVPNTTLPPSAELPLLLGAPRAMPGDAWVLPVLRPARAPGESPVVASLDPRRLLTVPAVEGAGALLLGADGQVHAAAGVAEDQLGRTLPSAQAEAAGRIWSQRPLGATGLTVRAMLPAPTSAGQATMVALSAAGLLTLLGGGGMLRRFWHQRQAAVGAAEAQAALATARLQLALTRAAAAEQQVMQVLGALDQGTCLLDHQLRLVAWNDRFAGLAGVAPSVLRPGVAAGDMQPPAETARDETAIRAALRHRLGDMRDRRNGCATRFRPDGSRVEDRWTTLDDGGLLLTCRLQAGPVPATELHPADGRPAPAAALADLCAEELRKRLPLLQQAVAAGDAANARMEAHAMRGVAANFGLAALAEILGQLEAAAKEQLVAELRNAAQGLQPLLDEALEALFSRAA